MRFNKKSITELLVAKAVETLGTSVLRRMGRTLPWATYNYSGGILGGTATGPTYDGARTTVAEVKIDFKAIAALRTAAGQAALAQNDLLQIMGLPIGIMVATVGVNVETVEGAAATIDVGDSGASGQYSAAVNFNAKALTLAPFANAKWYAAADNLTLKLNSANGYANSMAHIFAMLVDMRDART